MSVTIFSPAKINLYLAVIGRRADGFHELISVVAPLNFGDELVATLVERKSGGLFSLQCNHPEVPLDDSNLIMKAARAFAEASGWPVGEGDVGVEFKLTKRIPLGAGLGGGSSNAVAALRALNTLSGGLLPAEKLSGIAAKLGSDCALFLHDGPVVIRGRGERTTNLPETAAGCLKGRRIILFKPSFGISTPWAFGRMAAEAPRHYLPGPLAEGKLAAWLGNPGAVSALLFNNMEGVAFEKYVALPVMLEKFRGHFGVEARMSGSGSTCFALIDEPMAHLPGLALGTATKAVDPDLVTRMKHLIRQCWGEATFVQEASLI